MNCDTVNDDVTILDPLLGLLCVGQYYKTDVQVRQTFLISETARQSTREIVLAG